ncbi:MAG: T9SS type A sorting domain-containing protein, partial [Bacteroidales bacterium]|nr:T9SS type A sorting domain-containing protein [Bacteroidales bacterium]
SFTKVEDLHCERNLLFMDMNADSYPATTGTLSGTTTICAGEPADLIFNLTGTPPWTIIYTANGGSPQEVAANSSPYVLTVYPTSTTTYAFQSLEDIQCDGEVSGTALITVEPSPSTNAGGDQTIPYGTSTSLNGQASGGSGSYTYAWQPAGKLNNPNVQQPTTVNLTESTLFTLTATDNDGGCYDADDILVTITGGPLGCFPVADPPAICAGETSQLQSLASGGSGDYTFQWSSNPPGFSSTLSNPVVTPTQTTTYTVLVNDGYNLNTGNVTVSMHPLPVPDAGADKTIPHGTNTSLQGSASGGSGSYAYHWEPADKVSNPDIANPQTVNLYTTTLFTLMVTDLSTGCLAANPGQMAVIVAGDALAVLPSADPSEICYGESTALSAYPSGGSGTYTYSWTSSNGFTSNLQNPVTTPLTAGSFIYTCTIDDGFNAAQGSVAVNVRAVPFVDMGFADTTICVYDTVTLDAGNPGSTYVWSNGSSERNIQVATTGIGFDMQTYSVTVTNQSGCSAESSVNIVFDFSACTGIEGNADEFFCRIYPNPGKGTIRIQMKPGTKEVEVSVSNIYGQNIREPFLYRDLENNGGEVLILMDDQPDGVYFIHVRNEELISNTYKYILRR